jgi:hypothetical protein
MKVFLRFIDNYYLKYLEKSSVDELKEMKNDSKALIPKVTGLFTLSSITSITSFFLVINHPHFTKPIIEHYGKTWIVKGIVPTIEKVCCISSGIGALSYLFRNSLKKAPKIIDKIINENNKK